MTKINFNNTDFTLSNEGGFSMQGMPGAGLPDGFNPKELIEASVGLCVALVTRGILERDGRLNDGTKIDVAVSAAKDEGGENRIANFDIDVTLPDDIDEEYGKKLLVMVERGCTIGNTIRHGAKTNMRRV